jgi:TonB family protein
MTIPMTLILMALVSMKTENRIPKTEASLSNSDTSSIYQMVEKAPMPIGGMEEWISYINSNIQYPALANEIGIEGNVYVSFVVNREGQIQETQILRGIGGGCDEEALRLIKEAPDWTPGTQDGQDVNVRIRLPIKFKLPFVEIDSTDNQVESSLETSIETKKVKISPDYLYVIDGHVLDEKQDLFFINPTEIINFQILKNIEALDFYGAKSKNGIMIITTNKQASLKK